LLPVDTKISPKYSLIYDRFLTPAGNIIIALRHIVAVAAGGYESNR